MTTTEVRRRICTNRTPLTRRQARQIAHDVTGGGIALPCPFGRHWHAGPVPPMPELHEIALAMRGLDEPHPHDHPNRNAA